MSSAAVFMVGDPLLGQFVEPLLFGHQTRLEFLSNGVARLREEMPKPPVLPVAADFTKPFELPAGLGAKPRVGFFPGSTIGNFEPHEAHAFLRHAAALLGPGALLIIGVDTSAANVRMASFTGRSRGLNAKFMIFLSPFTRNA